MTKLNGHKAKPLKAKRKRAARIELRKVDGGVNGSAPFRVVTEGPASNFARSGNSTASVTVMTHARPCWVCTDVESGVMVDVHRPEDRWYQARADGCRQLGQVLGRYVSVDAVKLEWMP